jgi:hypothetical protein
MRYSALGVTGSGTYLSVYPVPIFSYIGGESVYASEAAVKWLKGAGMEIVREEEGLIFFKGGERGRVVLVPETHPAFNGGILRDWLRDYLDDVKVKELVKKMLVELIERLKLY